MHRIAPRSLLGTEALRRPGGGREGGTFRFPRCQSERDVKVDWLSPVGPHADREFLRTRQGEHSESEQGGKVHRALQGIGESDHPVTEPARQDLGRRAVEWSRGFSWEEAAGKTMDLIFKASSNSSGRRV